MERGQPPHHVKWGHRRIWWITLLLVSVPAMVVGLFVTPVPVTVIGVSMIGCCIGFYAVAEDFSWRSVCDGAAGPVLIAAGAPAFGHSTLPLMLAASATSPPVVHVFLSVVGADVRRGRADRPCGSSADIEACLGSMSGAELCEMWGRSFALVKSGRNVSQRLVGAGLRGSLLDELERRDQGRFADWLARRPCPASAPKWVVGTDSGSPS